VLPFSSERQYMATAHRAVAAAAPEGAADDAPRAVVVAKGAAERVLDLCGDATGRDGEARPLDRAAVLRVVDRLAGEGLRVLAVATRRERSGGNGCADDADDRLVDPDELAGTLTLAGVQAMLDPPRPEAVHAVHACHTAGIAVKMITGDHAATACAIARQVGVLADAGEGKVLTGPELAATTDERLPDAVESAAVFARVTPEQKLRLVGALQSRDHVVAMTGDGVNDAPALRQADIGVAMGRGGTEVAKEAADMVLTDDDFATIEAAVEEGRGVFDNLTKFIVWTLPTNTGEGLVILAAIVAGLTLPVLPVQILWINMTTAVLLGLMLAFEPKEAGIMARPPRDPRRRLITAPLVVRILLVSGLMVAGALWLFEWELAAGADVAEARTAAVNLFVVVEASYLFSCRSLTHSVWHVGFLSNPWLLGGVAVQALAQIAITYLPAMNAVFSTAPITGGAWLRIVGVAAVATLVVALDKRLRAARVAGHRGSTSENRHEEPPR
jgi:cation-transporting ATPase F